LGDSASSFVDHCLEGLVPNEVAIASHLENTLMLVTALNPHIGYDKAAQIAKKAHKEKSSLREAAVASGHLTGEQFDQWVNPEAMTRP
jgi:fumarate hydratase class II